MATKQSDETQIAVLVEKVGTMSITLTKLDAKFDASADKFYPKDEGQKLETKVSSLEGWRDKMIGALVVAQFIWGAVVYFLTKS